MRPALVGGNHLPGVKLHSQVRLQRMAFVLPTVVPFLFFFGSSILTLPTSTAALSIPTPVGIAIVG